MLSLLIGSLFLLNGTVCQVQATFTQPAPVAGIQESWEYRISGCSLAPSNQPDIPVDMRTTSAGAALLDVPGLGVLILSPVDAAMRQSFASLNYVRSDRWNVKVSGTPFAYVILSLSR